MNSKQLMRVIGATLLFSVGSLFAADGVWTNTVGGLWDDPANWQGGVVAGGESATAWLTNDAPGTLFITIPAGGVTAAKVAGRWNKVLKGGPLYLASATPTLASGYFMSDIHSADGLIFEEYSQVKTKIDCPGATVLKSGNTTVYMNHMATSTNAVDGNLLSTNALVFQGGNILFQGRPNTISRSHAWTLTEGETFITRTTSDFDSVPGAQITGTGIPEGTYLKRIFSTSVYELSQPASLSGLQTLTFSAIPSVETFQRFERVEMNASGVLNINKQTMPVCIEASELTGAPSFTFSKQGTGTFAVEKVDAFQGIVELKAGVLVFPANTGFFTGCLNLSGGVLTFPAGTGAITNRLASVTVTGQTELSVPGTGTVVVIDNLYGAGELVKTGAGTLQLVGSDGQGKVTVQGGRLLFEANPVEEESCLLEAAAFHTDASAAESLEFAAPVNGTNFVTKWADVRTNGIEAIVPAGAPKPFLTPAAQNGLPVLDFGSLKTQAVSWNHGGYMQWNVTNSAIREVFVVFSDTPDVTNMHNFFLGDVSTIHFHRGLKNGELLDATHSSASLKNGSVLLDTALVSAPTNTVLPSGFHLIALSATAPVQASTFGRDRFNRYGGIRLGEALVYTNTSITPAAMAQNDCGLTQEA